MHRIRVSFSRLDPHKIKAQGGKFLTVSKPRWPSSTGVLLGAEEAEEPGPTWGCVTVVCRCCWPQRGLSAPSASWPSQWARTTGCTPAGCAAPRTWTTTRPSARTRRSWPTLVCGGPAAPRVGHDSCLACTVTTAWVYRFPQERERTPCLYTGWWMLFQNQYQWSYWSESENQNQKIRNQKRPVLLPNK